MKVGDYVRTLDGIMRVIECRDNRFVNEDGNVYFYNDMMCNPSSNIIDLIEVGDYVNGKRVIKNCLEDGGNIILFEDGLCATNDEIKSIVTREMFESMEYKVGE